MTGHHDRQERDVLAPVRCAICDFLIFEQPLQGRFGWYHAACLEES